MARLLAVGAILWPVLLGTAVAARQSGNWPPWTFGVYAVASRICHQRPDRSFFTGGVQWPVCGRCSGLYAAAPIGALLALRRRRLGEDVSALAVVGYASVPTIVTLAVEWPNLAAVSSEMRAIAALPLGFAVAWVLVRTTMPSPVRGA